MDKKAVIKTIGQFRKLLQASGVKVDRLVLYGSWANGTAVDGSDIDLVVISQDFEGMGFWRRTEILSSAIYEVYQPIEAFAMTPEEWHRGESMICHFARDGEFVN